MPEYYTRRVLKQISSANSYADLLSVGTAVVRSIAHDNPFKPIAMVCEPISTGNSNSRDVNLRIFSRTIDRVSAGGLLVFSQMPFEKDMERIYKSDPALQGLRLLEEFYLPIFQTGLIKLLCFIPEWEKSVGASWEHEQAKALNIPRIYLAESYVKD